MSLVAPFSLQRNSCSLEQETLGFGGVLNRNELNCIVLKQVHHDFKFFLIVACSLPCSLTGFILTIFKFMFSDHEVADN